MATWREIGASMARVRLWLTPDVNLDCLAREPIAEFTCHVNSARQVEARATSSLDPDLHLRQSMARRQRIRSGCRLGDA